METDGFNILRRDRTVSSSWEYYVDRGHKFLSVDQCFLMQNDHYFLSYSDSKLYRLILVATRFGTITIAKEYQLQYAPIENTAILVLEDVLYYFSNNGLCAVKVSDTEADSNIISSITDETSALATDKKDRIWIINETAGAVEYNITEQKEKKIAEYPASNKSEIIDIYSRVCFYSENNLYYITNQNVFSLDLTQQEEPDELDEPDNPDNPTRQHDQSGHTCGLLGLEFVFILAGLSLLCKYRK